MMNRKVLEKSWVRWTAGVVVVILIGLIGYAKGYNDKRDEVVKAFSRIGKTQNSVGNTTSNVQDKKFKDLGTVKVGDDAFFRKIKFTITGASLHKTIKGRFHSESKPELGQFLVVDLEGENTGDDMEKYYSAYFRLADNSGHDYENHIGSSSILHKRDHSIWGDSFNPGGKKKFRLCFDVPDGDISNYKIQIQYDDGVQYMALT